MREKKFILLMGILSLIIFFIGCSTKDAMPVKLTSEDSIKEIISSKGDKYNFLNDSVYLDNIDSVVKSLTSEYTNSQINYTIGHLDEDNIPEIAIFIGKDTEDAEDKGSLEIYKFNGVKYALLDSVSMNFDISNYQMKIGNISKKEKGIFLNNKTGSSSGVTYGFMLEDGKIKSILSDKKMNLVSISTENQIKDINDDGIMEFSVFTIDPETEILGSKEPDTMTIWYKWNEIDSGEILEIEREDLSKEASDSEIYSQLEETIEDNFSDFINVFSNNKDKLSNYDNTHLLQKYIDKLDLKSYDKTLQIENLFIDYQRGQSFNYVFDKYGITLDKLNNLEYLNRDKVLKEEKKIKNHLIENISLGYKLNAQEGIYYYLIDYKKLLNLFSDNLTREYRDYLQILSLNSEEPFLNDGALTISSDNLVDRILLTESFKMIYPYSDLIPEINDIYELYFNIYLFGDIEDSKFDSKTGKIKEEALEDFKSKVEKYQYTNFADILRDFIEWIEENSYMISDDIRDKLTNRLN